MSELLGIGILGPGEARGLFSIAIAAVVTATPAAEQRALPAAAAQMRATRTLTMTYQGRNRRYLLHAPDHATGALVVAFHGGAESPENLEDISGFSALADRGRFIVAYPAGIDLSWADGRGSTAAAAAPTLSGTRLRAAAIDGRRTRAGAFRSGSRRASSVSHPGTSTQRTRSGSFSRPTIDNRRHILLPVPGG
jgi:hypothetical protein